MSAYHLQIRCLITAAVICAAGAQETNRNSWHPNTGLLEEAAKYADPVFVDAAKTLNRDVNSFYQLLRDKQWHETYMLRAKVFREDVQESDYIAQAKQAEKRWGLVNYEVLSCDLQRMSGSTNFAEAILICKFTELPGYAVSYSTVFWHKEDGVWKCLSAGPSKLGIFRGTRPPIIDW